MTYPGVLATVDVMIRRNWREVADGAGGTQGAIQLRGNDYGVWQWVWPIGTPAYAELFAALNSGEDLGDWGLVFRHPGTEIIFASGPVTTIIAAEGNTNGVSGDALSAWGVTELTHWRERLIMPDSTVTLPDANTTGTGGTFPVFTDTRTGHAEDLLLDYLRANLTAGLAYRRLQDVTVTVPANRGAGPIVTLSPQANTNVLEVAQTLALISGTSFDMVQTGPGTAEVKVWDRQVRQGIVFSVDLGTAAGVRLKKQRRRKTQIIASGSGNDSTVRYARLTAATPVAGVVAPPSGYSEVREEFIKSSGDDANLILKASQEIIEDGPELGLAVEPADGVPWLLGQDYMLDDTVVGVLGGEEFEIPIHEVLINHQDDTLSQQATVGFSDTEDISLIIEDLTARLRRVEERA